MILKRFNLTVLLIFVTSLNGQVQFSPNRRPHGLLQNLAWHYSLNANNVYVDDIGTNDLTNFGSTIGTNSIIGKGPHLNGSTSALVAAPNPSHAVTNTDFTVAFWCYTTVSNQAFAGTVGKNSDPASPFNGDEWRFQYQDGRHTFTVGNGGGGRDSADCGTLQYANQWALIIGMRSNSHNLFLTVNNGVFNMTEFGFADINDLTIEPILPGCCSELEIGRVRGGSYFNGIIDDVSFWTNRLLTVYEKSMIWNAGHGGMSRWIAAQKGGQP